MENEISHKRILTIELLKIKSFDDPEKLTREFQETYNDHLREYQTRLANKMGYYNPYKQYKDGEKPEREGQYYI